MEQELQQLQQLQLLEAVRVGGQAVCMLGDIAMSPCNSCNCCSWCRLQQLQLLQLVQAVRVGGKAVCLLGDIVPLLTAYLLRLQVVYSSSSSIGIYDGLYPAYGALV
jgi:hypothetical protein